MPRNAAKLKVVAIVGPTGSGKSAWAVNLARRFSGVVISADSRQVYKGLDTITAKITTEEMGGVPHYLMDLVPVGSDFNVTKYQRLAYRLLDQIKQENKKGNHILPILTGGTGLYVAAVCDGYQFAKTKPNKELREKLDKKSLAQLQKMLIKLDPEISVDLNNPRRVIRAIEIAISGEKIPAKNPKYESLKIGIAISPANLEKNIRKRVRRLDLDKVLEETKKISRYSNSPLSTWYQPAKEFLTGKITKPQMLEAMIKADLQYAKRQMTWWRKDKTVQWVKSPRGATQMVANFVNPAKS